jgi:hypothetical protein
MKSKANNDDLAKWCAALAANVVTDEVPPGWHTARELGERLGICESSMGKKLTKSLREGRIEKKLFRVVTGQVTRAVPHYFAK